MRKYRPDKMLKVTTILVSLIDNQDKYFSLIKLELKNFFKSISHWMLHYYSHLILSRK